MDKLKSLQERAKELQCIYNVEQILSDRSSTIDNNFYKILEIIPKGWSFALEDFNQQKTGYKLDEGLIDMHIITDEDIKNKNSYAVMINNVNHSARLLRK
jgi:hypothetical protein